MRTRVYIDGLNLYYGAVNAARNTAERGENVFTAWRARRAAGTVVRKGEVLAGQRSRAARSAPAQASRQVRIRSKHDGISRGPPGVNPEI